mgnify:CR=1 FL=1
MHMQKMITSMVVIKQKRSNQFRQLSKFSRLGKNYATMTGIDSGSLSGNGSLRSSHTNTVAI